MNRLNSANPTGLNSSGVRTWGMLLLCMGLLGRALIQNHILNIGQATGQQMLEVLQSSGDAMLLATCSLVLQAAETCAAPLFCFLLVQGFFKTSNFQNYLLRVLGLAAVSEIPYNLAFTGRVLDLSSRNPVFGMALCLVVLHFFRRYTGKGLQNLLIKLAVFVAGMVWAKMLSIDSADCCLVLVTALWACWSKPNFRTLVGCCAAVVCSLFSPFYLLSPMSFLILHSYNGEKGEENRLFNYLAYPVLLLAVWGAAMFVA